MNKKIKVIIADDHVFYRDGLCSTINADMGMQVIAEARDATQLLKMVRSLEPDVVVTDLRMPGDGIKAIQQLSEEGFLRIIAISSFENDDLIIEALEAGALGYVMKNANRGEIEEAIKLVFDFIPYYSQSTSPGLLKDILKSNFNPYKEQETGIFTEDERRITTFICEGKTTEEIARILFLSTRKIDRIRRSISKKMNVKTISGVVIYAVKKGLYSGPPY